jgi:hypothetical protein
VFVFIIRQCWQCVVKFYDLDVLTKFPYVVYKYFYLYVITLVYKNCTDVRRKQHISVACYDHAVSVCVILCSQNKTLCRPTLYG